MADSPSKLLILWANAQKETARNMVFLYAVNSLKHHWWEEVTLLIWGETARMAAEDDQIRADLRQARQAGVRVIACKACAQNLNVAEVLEEQGVEVFYTGEFLTGWLKSGEKLLTI